MIFVASLELDMNANEKMHIFGAHDKHVVEKEKPETRFWAKYTVADDLKINFRSIFSSLFSK